MSTAAPVQLAIDAHGIARVTLDRADKHNAFDAETVARLREVFVGLARNASARVVVLQGAGPTFCAGADLDWMRKMAALDSSANFADARALTEMLAALDRLPKPTIARVQGPAYGGGVGLIACCDIAIGVTTARFALTEVRLGVVPAAISPYVIAAIGTRLARRYLLTAETLSAAVALEARLLHEVCEPAKLDEAVSEQIELLLKAGPEALRECKELIREVHAARGTNDELRASTAHRLARLRMSEEGREGMNAFLEKRPPSWSKKDG
ncbi:MAG TPA: enoyl-CoA hydratase-related protein [Steroidobacteraceae bacterium]|nr:enoyl-CoA hydratase-related protein [Steroidobacteraceae bacterium]